MQQCKPLLYKPNIKNCTSKYSFQRIPAPAKGQGVVMRDEQLSLNIVQIRNITVLADDLA